MVDQDETGALVLAVFTPADIEPDGTVGGAVVASFAYSCDPERRAPARSLGAASHMAALDPPTALALAAWLETAADFADRATQLDDLSCAARLIRSAETFARSYLRERGTLQ